MFSRPRLRALLVSAVALFLWHPPAATAQQLTQRLILKDGSFQSIQKYELQGDRVHFFSAERFDWEDIPASLIDWEATKKYNDELSSGKMRSRAVESSEEKEEREKEEANSPEISPGLRLPGSGGVFLFDQFQGKPELAQIVQNGSEVNKASEKGTLHAVFGSLAGSKQAFELKGAHAQIQSHVPRPSIYIDIDAGPQGEAPQTDRFRLLRLQGGKDKRVLGDIKLSVTGKISQQTSVLPAALQKVGTGEWIKLTPTEDLPPGEYAVVEMLTPEDMNMYVWDFGVNSSAPANPNTWQPAK